MTSPVLQVEELSVRFGGIAALTNVSFCVNEHEFVALIGPNGAGKTTLLRAIAGLNAPARGRIVLNGREISHDRVARRMRSGLSLSHQIVRPFRSLTLLENVMIAVGKAQTSSAMRAIFSLSRDRSAAEARELLRLVGIDHLSDALPGTQPLGVLKRLEVARALGTRPSILLLDEPLAGLGTKEAIKLADLLIEINQRGATIVLIEHNLKEAKRACQRFVVLDNGHLIANGATSAVLEDPAVIAAYLGKERGHQDA